MVRIRCDVCDRADLRDRRTRAKRQTPREHGPRTRCTVRVAIVTLGTTGDVLPFVALARRAIERGHDAYLVLPDDRLAIARRYNVPARTFGDVPRAEIEDIIERLVREPNVFRHPGIIAAAHAQSKTIPIGRATIEATRDADVIVSHRLALMGLVAAEAQRKPLVTVHLFPNLIASARMSPDGGNYGPLNGLGWWLGNAIVRRSADPAINEILRSFDLPARRDAMLSTGDVSVRALLAVSPSVLETDPLWPRSIVTTGFWFLEEPAYDAPEALRAYLARGTPPIVVTFGSLIGANVPRLARVAVEAILASGNRAIVQTGWQDLGDFAEDTRVLRVGFVPHAWLFAQTLCAITHGGAGTTAALLRAGVPAIIAPFYGDQRFWGSHLHRIGVAPPMIERWSFSQATVGNRIARIANDRAMRARARALGDRIRAEDGSARAVSELESVYELT